VDGSRLPLEPFLTGEGAVNMINKKRLSIFLTFLLALQLIIPFINSFASEIIGVPKNLIVQKQNFNDIYLKWDPVYGATGYRIYKMNEGKNELIGESSAASWYGVKVKAGTYNLVVTALKGTSESAFSSTITIEIVFPEVAAPKVYTPTIVNGNDILLQWDKVQYGTNYNIYQTINGQKQLVATTNQSNYTFVKMSQGEYLFEIKTFSDRFGESVQGAEVDTSIIFPEIEPPTQLTQLVSNGNDVLLQWKAQLYATNYNIYKVIDGQRELVDKTNRIDYFFSRLKEGEYTFEITTVNDRFGESEQGTKVNVSIVYPKIESPLQLTSTIVQGNDVLLQWKAAKYAQTYNIFQIVNGQRIFIDKTNRTDYYLSRLPEGQYVYEITTVNDRFGESNPGSQTNFSIVYPKIQPPTGLTSTLNKGTDVFLEWKAASYATSYNIYRLVDGQYEFIKSTSGLNFYLTELNNEEYVFAITAVSSRFGESKVYSQTSIFVGTPIINAPVVYLGQDKNDATINWANVKYADFYNIYELVNGTANFIGKSTTNSYVIEDLSNGLHEFVVTTENESFGESTYSNKVYAFVKPELEAPEASSPTIDGDDLTLTWEPVADAGSYNVYKVIGEERVLVVQTADTNITIKDLDSGNYEFRIVPVSNDGTESDNYTTVVVQKEQFDTTPPQTVGNESNNWLQIEYEVELTATDDQSGVAKTYYSINGSEFTEGTSFTVSEEGINTVSFYSVDKAGNVEEVKSTKVKIDKTAPVTVSNITDNWNKVGVTVALTATDDLSGVTTTYYSINGSEYLEGSSLTVSGEGINQVSFYSVDKAGNVEEAKTVLVKIDKTAPETVSDVNDKWNTGDVTVKLTSTDNQSGVATTFYSVNGSEYVEGTEFTVSQEGINKVSFYSVDNVGNVEVAKTVDVKVDKTAPTTISDITDKWNQNQVAGKLAGSDELSGVAKTYYSINGSEFVEGTQFTVNQEGMNSVSFYSIDNAGNKEEEQTVEVKIDKTAPVVTWDLVNQLALGSSLPIAYKAYDAHSGIAKETIAVNGQVYENAESVKLDKPGKYQVVVTVTDHAGWTTTLEKTIEVYIPATLIVNPGVIKANAGDFTVKISLPKGYDTNQIDLSTATLNGVYAKSGTNGLVQQAKNGQFKFNRDDFDWKKGLVTVEFRVLVNGILVIGSTTVEVK
jgi:large repetitive protein